MMANDSSYRILCGREEKFTMKSLRRFSVMFSVLVFSLAFGALSAFASEGAGTTYDAAWVGEQMTSGFATASTNILYYIGLALIGGLGCFGVVIGIRAALRVFSAVSKGRG